MDLFNYVMQTPANTNPAVLSSEISKAIEESQVQADYAQNDPNKKDYIKNRPCYSEITNTKRIFTNLWGGEFSPPLGLIKGEKYIFGTGENPTKEYICRDAHDENDSYPVGTLSAAEITSET